jgi:hypothetical protein
MIDVIPPLGEYKYDTCRILLVKCYIDNSMRFAVMHTKHQQLVRM